MILITGSTGNLGNNTVDYLLQKGVPPGEIVALVRDENKSNKLVEKGITIRVGDYNNYDSLVRSFEGIQKIFWVSGTDTANATGQAKNIVDAAHRTNVKQILYTSFERKNETETSPLPSITKAHLEAEKSLRHSGIAYTIFRNNLYLDVLPYFLGEMVGETGVVFPAGSGQTSFALRKDMAEAVGNVLTSQGHENKEYALSNIENYTMQDVATVLSRIFEKPMIYHSPSPEVYISTLLKKGAPVQWVNHLSGFAEAIKQGEFSTKNTDLEYLLGRKPVSLDAYLKQFYM